MKKYIIYCHTNTCNGKKYIGITSKSANSRWRNGEGYRNNHHFYRAIKKFGWNSFSHDILFEVETEEEALAIEEKLILETKSYDSKYGYNKLIGGNINDEANKHFIISRKVESGAIKKVVNIETGEIFLGPKDAERKTGIDASSICGVCTHKKNAFTAGGYHWCYEDEYENYITPKQKQKNRPIINIDTGESYEGIRTASRKTGIYRAHISQVCHGKASTAGGYRWAFLDVDTCIRVQKSLGKKVVNLDTGEVFNTIKEAAMSVGTSLSNISMVCRGETSTAKGFHWAYVEEEKARYNRKPASNKKAITRSKKKVRNIDLGIVYDSIAEAARSCGVSYNNISAVCNGRAKTSGGYRWEFV